MRDSCDDLKGYCGDVIHMSGTVYQECIPRCSGPGSTWVPVDNGDD
jgi:hypothetical protein